MTALQQFWYSRAAIGPTVEAEVSGATVTVEALADAAFSWLWDFGDGTTSTARNPAPHTFATPGPWVVTLTTTYATADACSTYQVVTTLTLDEGAPPVHVCTEGPLWSLVTPPAMGRYMDVAWGNGVFVATAGIGFDQQRVVTSVDGLTWSAPISLPPWPTLPLTEAVADLVFGNGVFVAGARASHPVAKSADGVTWALAGTSGTPGGTLQFAGGLFWRLLSTTLDAGYSTSTDALTWTANTLLYPGRPQPNWISFSNGAYYAASAFDLFRSTTGAPGSWVQTTVPAFPGTMSLYEVTDSGDGTLVATFNASGSTDRVLVSVDNGFTWTAQMTAGPANRRILSAQGVGLTYGNGTAISTLAAPSVFTASARSLPHSTGAYRVVTNGTGLYLGVSRTFGLQTQLYRGVCE
jgi:PKD repeat protein